MEKLKLQDVQFDSSVSCLVSHSSNHYPIMMVVPLTETELIGIIDSLKNKNSNKILRLCGHLVSKPLSYIFNKSLSLAFS